MDISWKIATLSKFENKNRERFLKNQEKKRRKIEVAEVKMQHEFIPQFPEVKKIEITNVRIVEEDGIQIIFVDEVVSVDPGQVERMTKFMETVKRVHSRGVYAISNS